jgi:hypothetical protein
VRKITNQPFPGTELPRSRPSGCVGEKYVVVEPSAAGTAVGQGYPWLSRPWITLRVSNVKHVCSIAMVVGSIPTRFMPSG